MDRLDAMRHFVRVAELGSFSAVAKQSGLARSVVTRHVAALESQLGGKLLTRSTRRVALTPAGAAYLEQCRVILNLVDAAESGLAAERQAPRGHIRLSVPQAFGLARLGGPLLDFAVQYPEVSLAVDYTDRSVDLIEGGIDLSIRITLRLAPGVVARRLGSCPMRLVASREYLARHGRPRRPADLADHEFLAYSHAPAASLPFLVDGRVQGFPVRSRISSSSGEWLAQAAARGFGLTCHPDFIVDPFIERGEVVQVLADHAMPDLGIHALLPSNRHVPHRVRVLLDFLAAALAPPPGRRARAGRTPATASGP